jgi:hypothetical protein
MTWMKRIAKTGHAFKPDLLASMIAWRANADFRRPHSPDAHETIDS